MKNALLLIFALVSVVCNGQKDVTLQAFDALDSNIGANINIIKSSEYRILLSGDKETLEHISWAINDKSLEIRPAIDGVSFEEVQLTIYTKSLEELRVSDGGKTTMDASFARLDHFEVTASGDAIVDLSRIAFITLVANSKLGGQIIYADPGTPF